MVAAAVAMAASMSVMAAVVVADIAEARATEAAELDDALTEPNPVMMRKLKIEAPIILEDYDDSSDDFDDGVKRVKPKAVRFGRFEGY